MERYNAHNDCLVYLQRHCVTTLPTSSWHCKLPGIFWDSENQLISYSCCHFVTILMKCFIWIKCCLSQGACHKHAPAWKGYRKYSLYRSLEPEHLQWGLPTSRDTELNMLSLVVQVQGSYLSEDENDTNFCNAFWMTNILLYFGLVFDSKSKSSNKLIV